MSIHRWTNYKDLEKTDDYYWIISRNFVDGTINVNKWPMKHKLLFYALAMQSKYGDADEDAPSKFWLVDWVKWNSWNRLRGVAPRDAIKQFIMYAEALLAYLLSGVPELEEEGLAYVTEASQDYTMW